MIIQWSPGVTLAGIERQVIEAAFNHYRQNKSATANALGVSVRTLDNKFTEYAKADQDDKEANAKAEREREHFLKRARGEIKPPVPVDAPRVQGKKNAGAETGKGADVESASAVTEKPSVPVQERPEIQDVLPPKVAANGSRRNR